MIPRRSQHSAPTRAVSLILAGALLGLVQVDGLLACYVHSGQYQGLSVEHPLSVPVSVSTRQAIVGGELNDIPRATVAERAAALKQLVAVVAMFGKLVEADAATDTAPDFAVLLSESGLWTGFSSGGQGTWQVRQHLDGPAENDVVIVVSDPGMAALLRGETTVAQAVATGVVRVGDDSPHAQRSLAIFARFVDRFSGTSLARFRLDRKIPEVGFATPVSRFVRTPAQ